jgi:hypothetical protein
MPETNADRIHQLVVDGFQALGVSNPEAVSRRILVEAGWFVGYRFLCEGLQAVRRADSEEIIFYDASGMLLTTVPIKSESLPAAA